MRRVSDELFITTTMGHMVKKFVTQVLERVLNKDKVDLVVAVGPVIMMKMTSLLTEVFIPTLVSLNPIMVDGTGMCSCCPGNSGESVNLLVWMSVFDSHQVDFDELMAVSGFI